MTGPYTFDYQAFYADPEGYHFTEEDLRYWNARELDEYELTVPMTPTEKRALRRWVASGHSVYDHPGSRYVCLAGTSPEPDFLDVYRMDQELKKMDPAERTAYIKELTGYQEDEPEEVAERRSLYQDLPMELKEWIRKRNREVFYLWMFISEEGLTSMAKKYLDEYMDEPIPFEDSL